VSIDRFSSNSPFEDVIGYSRVVRAGDLYVTAGCTATVDGQLVGIGDAHQQAVAAFTVGIDALHAAGCPRESIVQTRMYLSDHGDAEAVGRAHHGLLGDVRPVATMIVVSGFIDARMLVEIELTGWTGEADL
jgi:enamine deaminase RidA (YjgF/YER057c/UK114 family)